MAVLLAILFVTLPLDAFGRVVAGSLVTPADVVGSGNRDADHRATRNSALPASSEARQIDPRVRDFSVARRALRDSFRTTPPQILTKGLVQIGGVSIMLLACIATMNEVARRPVLFAGYVRLSVIVLAMVSLIGIAQFVLANALGHPGILEFSFLNRWSGGNVWFNLGSVDGIVRANSIMQEPSALGMVLGTGGGSRADSTRSAWAGAYRNALQEVIPRWTAISILAGFVVTFP